MDRERSLLEEIVDDASVLHYEDTADVDGACGYCGCTYENACVLEVDDPAAVSEVVTCGWFRRPDESGLGVCTNPECVKAYIADQGAP